MRKELRLKLNGDESRGDATASFTLPFDTRDVWGKAKVPVRVTINGYTWRSTVGNREAVHRRKCRGTKERGCKGGRFCDHHA